MTVNLISKIINIPYGSKKTQEMLEETLGRSQGIIHNELMSK